MITLLFVCKGEKIYVNCDATRLFKTVIFPNKLVQAGIFRTFPFFVKTETTKVRIVVDSAASFKGTSLNDTMLTGPKLQRQVLLRFRQKPVVLDVLSRAASAEGDRSYHSFLWRDLDLTKPVDVYEAVCLVFGDKAFP